MTTTKQLIERLLAHAALHDEATPHDDEQRQFASDLREAARMVGDATDEGALATAYLAGVESERDKAAAPAPPAEASAPLPARQDAVERIASFLKDRDDSLTPDDANDVERAESARLILGMLSAFATSKDVRGWRLVNGVRVYTVQGAFAGHSREFVALDDFQAKATAPATVDAEVEFARLRHAANQCEGIGAAGIAMNIMEAVDKLSAAPAPVKMILHCPACHLQHIDAPDERTPDWKNEPHRSHLCHGCGHIWRPADVPTEGVAAIETRGKADSAAPAPGVGEATSAGYLCDLVARLSSPSLAGSWTCGLAAETLIWLMRCARLAPVLMHGKVNGVGHCWVECDGRYFDPTIAQFGDGLRTVGILPHPLANETEAAIAESVVDETAAFEAAAEKIPAPQADAELRKARDEGHDSAIRFVLGHLKLHGDVGGTVYEELLRASGREQIIRSAIEHDELDFTGLREYVLEYGSRKEKALVRAAIAAQVGEKSS